MLKNVTKKTKLSLLIIGLIFTGVLGALVFFDSDSTEAAVDFTYNPVAPAADVGDINLGDGVCDSGLGVCSFRAAIEEANADGGSTEIVFLNGGSHVANSDVTITQPVSITGPENEIVYLDGAVTNSPLVLQGGSGGSNFSNLTLTNCDGTDGCIYASEIIDNITVDNITFDGLIIIGGDDWTIQNNTFNGANISISNDGLINNILIDNNTFNNCTNDELISLSGNNIFIIDNTIDNIGDTSIDVDMYGGDYNFSGNTITGNLADAMEFGLYDDVNNVFINNNTLSDMFGIGIGLGADGGLYKVNDLEINNNDIDNILYKESDPTNPQGMGIVVVTIYQSQVEISNNNIYHTDGQAIIFGVSDDNDCVVEGNIIENSNSGILIVQNNGNIDILDNYITDSDDSGIEIEDCSGSLNIASNTISDSGSYGIEFVDSMLDDVFSMDNNIISNNYGGGICIGTEQEESGAAFPSSGIISNNTLIDNTIIGMEIQGGGGMTFSNNLVSGSKTGIWLVENSVGIASNMIFSSNTMENNALNPITDFSSESTILTYGGRDYYPEGDNINIFLASSGSSNVEISDSSEDSNYLSFPDGINNFNLAMVSDNNDSDFRITAFIREDFINDSATTETEFNSWSIMPDSDFVVDVWQEDVWIANGATEDYSWNLTAPGVTEDGNAELVYDPIYSSAYLIETNDNIFTNETLSGNGNGFVFTNKVDNNIVTDSNISSIYNDIFQYDIHEKYYGINYINNTSFNSYDILDGTIDVNYDVRVHLIDDEGNHLENAVITASYNPTFDLGETDENGQTDYTSLDAASINIDGIDNNEYTFTAIYNGETSSIQTTLSEPDQEISLMLDLTEPPPTYSISGYVKKDETGVENAELHIYDSQDDLLSILQTNSEGYYRSSDLEEGIYEIILQPASLPDLNGYTLLEVNPRLVTLSDADAEVDFNYSSSPVVNENTNGNTNRPYVNYNYNTNTNSNTNVNANNNSNANENSNTNSNENSNENQNTNQQIFIVNANVNLNTNSNGEESIIEQKVYQDLILEGTAEPNTKIIITIELENGETISVETITDSQGNWQVVFDKGKIPGGDHTIYIQTELNGQLSEMVELAKLVVAIDKKISTQWMIGIIVAILVFIVIIILLIIYLNKKKNQQVKAV